MPYCSSCNKNYVSEDLSTIGNQFVCCLSCVGLLKANDKDACSYCGRPVWKDDYYELDNNYFCSEKCKNNIQKEILKDKKVKYVKFRHFKEEKYYNNSPDKIKNIINEKKVINEKKSINLPEKNIYQINDVDDWNRNSFIQKSDFNENENEKNMNKEEEFIKDENKKQISYQKKNEDNIMKCLMQYFREDDIHNYRKYQRARFKHKSKKANIVRNLMNNKDKDKDKDNNIYKLSSLPNLNYNTKNEFIIENNSVEKNPFKKDNVIKNDNIFYSDNKNNSRNYENSKYSSNTIYVFNPIRKTENIKVIKHCSYPIDSLAFPLDSLPAKSELIRDSSINCCFNCKKPILLRNSNCQKDFCSLICRNEYYKKK